MYTINARLIGFLSRFLDIYMYVFFFYITTRHGKNCFIKVSEKLATYRSENNFVEPSK